MAFRISETSWMTAGTLLGGRSTRRRPFATATLVAGVAAMTLAFMAIQVAAEITDYGFPGSWLLSLENESGLAERLGEAMAVATAVTLLLGRRLEDSRPAAAWAAVWLYIATDDALRIHERSGAMLGDRIGDVGPFEADVVGELVFVAIMGALLLGLVVATEIPLGRRRSAVTRGMLLPAGLFAFFSVVLDAVTADVPYGVAIEDGGEMFALGLALIAAITWHRSIADGRSVDEP
jgi:hypothetical protein